MSCDACKRVRVLTGKPCNFCGRLNVEAELAAAQLEERIARFKRGAPKEGPSAAALPTTGTKVTW